MVYLNTDASVRVHISNKSLVISADMIKPTLDVDAVPVIIVRESLLRLECRCWMEQSDQPTDESQ